MNKKLLYTLLALLLAVLVGFTAGLIRSRSAAAALSRDAFVPATAGVVWQVQGEACSSGPVRLPGSGGELGAEWESLLFQADSLTRAGVLLPGHRTAAWHGAGETLPDGLLIATLNEPMGIAEFTARWQQYFPQGKAEVQKAGGEKSGRLIREERDTLHLFLAGNHLLLAGSESWLTAAIRSSRQGGVITPFTRVQRFFSPDAAAHLYLNQAVHFPGFDWGALDMSHTDSEVVLSGFAQPEAAGVASVFKRQQPCEGVLEEVLPEQVVAMECLRLSRVDDYLADLAAQRVAAGIGEEVEQRKSEFVRNFGEHLEQEWQTLLQGEMAKGIFRLRPEPGQQEGVLVVCLKSGSIGMSLLGKMMTHYASVKKVPPGSLQQAVRLSGEESLPVWRNPQPDLCRVLWGELLGGVSAHWLCIVDNYLVAASSMRDLEQFVRGYGRHSSLRQADWYARTRASLANRFNYMALSAAAESLPPGLQHLSACSGYGRQWVGSGDMIYLTEVVNTQPQVQRRAQVVWQTGLEAPAAMKPVLVVNPATGEREVLVQDTRHTLYLISDEGRVCWKLPLPGAINSEVYPVDARKNGQVQYCFSTESHLYLIDRNGNHLPRFPLALRSRCEVGITLYDYDNQRDYRIFAPGADRRIYLYELSGDPVKGWGMPKSDHPVVSRLSHYRVGDKDYLVFADQSRLYILDRRGKPRVRTNHLYALAPGTRLYLSAVGGKPAVVFADRTGEVQWVAFDGSRGSRKMTETPAEFCFQVADTDGDGRDEWIFAGGDRLLVYSSQGTLIFSHRQAGAAWEYPYIYRFSARDIRIGLFDTLQRQICLFTPEGLTPGFPIGATTPFSIAFLRQGSPGFYLFAGSGENQLLKYKVE